MKPEEIQQEVGRLLDLESRTVERNQKQKLASLALTLAQKAEAMSRVQQPDVVTAESGRSLKAVTDSNIEQFVEQFYAEKDPKQRNLYHKLMLFEDHWYGLKEERLDRLQRLLRDCDGRVLRCRELLDLKRAGGVPTDGEQALLENLLEARQLLRTSLRSELARQDQA